MITRRSAQRTVSDGPAVTACSLASAARPRDAVPVTPSPQPPFGVLILPGGTEIGLEIRRSLADLKEIELAGAGALADRHGPFAYRRWATVPSVTEPGWQDELNAVIERLRIDFVFPGHDDALLALAENADAITARIVTSPAHTCRL